MMIRSGRIITNDLLNFLRNHYRLNWQGIHGVKHWARVRANGLAVAKENKANTVVVELFAFLHDSCRRNDNRDPQHGSRAAKLALSLQGRFYRLPTEDLDRLTEACAGHTHEATHTDTTIATCWDADRLDLGRVGIEPDPFRLCTETARKMLKRKEGEDPCLSSQTFCAQRAYHPNRLG